MKVTKRKVFSNGIRITVSGIRYFYWSPELVTCRDCIVRVHFREKDPSAITINHPILGEIICKSYIPNAKRPSIDSYKDVQEILGKWIF